MIRCLSAVLLLFATVPAIAQEDLSNIYDLEATFDPGTGALAVEGRMTIVADGPIERIELLLNKGVVVRRFTFGDGRSAIIEPDVVISGQALPRTQKLVLPLEAPLARGERLELAFAYQGRIGTEDIEIGRGVVTPGWTEMTLEALWYPVFLAEPQVRSRLMLQLPEQYEVVGPGTVERIAPGRWRLDPGTPVAGRITFALSDSWVAARERLNAGISAVLYSVEPEPRAAEILGTVRDAFAFYQERFGAPRSPKKEIRLLYPNRDPGLVWPNQAYSTGGDLIVMNLSALQTQLDTLNHEVAHLWWFAGRPGTPDEFMSESISEYLALRRGQSAWGDAWLASRRASMAEASAKIKASLLDIDGFGGPRQALMYERGPTALWLLHDRIGAARMDKLLKAAYVQEVSTLDDFVALLAVHADSNTASWFRENL